MYSTHNEGRFVITEIFIRTLKNKIFKYTIDKLDYMVNKYNNTYHSPIKMKPVDVKPNTYIDSYKETNKKNTKRKIGDNVRISNNKNIFAKGYTWNLSEEVFVSKNS